MIKIKFISIILGFKIIFGVSSNYLIQHLCLHLIMVHYIWKWLHRNCESVNGNIDIKLNLRPDYIGLIHLCTMNFLAS